MHERKLALKAQPRFSWTGRDKINFVTRYRSSGNDNANIGISRCLIINIFNKIRIIRPVDQRCIEIEYAPYRYRYSTVLNLIINTTLIICANERARKSTFVQRYLRTVREVLVSFFLSISLALYTDVSLISREFVAIILTLNGG